ncbi:MAG: hypothetical protein R2800_15055 [Flavipsychrobacter sp.]
MKRIALILSFIILAIFSACKKNEPDASTVKGTLDFWMQGKGYVYEYLYFNSNQHESLPVYWSFSDGYHSYNRTGTHKFRDTGTFYVVLAKAADTTIHVTKQIHISLGATRMQKIKKWHLSGSKKTGSTTTPIAEDIDNYPITVSNDNKLTLPPNQNVEAIDPIELQLDQRVGEHYQYTGTGSNDTVTLLYLPKHDSISIQRTRTVGNTTYTITYQSEKY